MTPCEGLGDPEETTSLPDLDDRHVVAAAIPGGVQANVTSNMADFPPDSVVADLESVDPDDFPLERLDLGHVVVQEVVREQGAYAKATPLAVQDFIFYLDETGVPKFADELGCLFASRQPLECSTPCPQFVVSSCTTIGRCRPMARAWHAVSAVLRQMGGLVSRPSSFDLRPSEWHRIAFRRFETAAVESP
jgi:hypothetical protein